MKFRYYITDLMRGCIVGTNETKEAESVALCEDYFVVDTETGEQLAIIGGRVPVEAV